jgi:sugar lactone lactonase YvrE
MLDLRERGDGMDGGPMVELGTLADGLSFPESPRWHGGRLWVSDWGAGQVLAIGHDRQVEVVARVDAFPLCIDHLPDGRLLVVAGSDHRILRQEPDGSLVTHADLSSLSEHPWNDIVADARGNVYVNNIGFDFPGGAFAPGVVAVVAADGSVRQVAEGLAFPNGMAITPDESTLIVAESYGSRLTAYDIGPDGSLSAGRPWANVDGYPDGICVDAENAVWYADVPNKRCTRVREGGEVAQVIELDRGGFACVLGGEDRRTLFIATNVWSGSADGSGGSGGGARGQVRAVEVAVPGAGRP